MPIPHTMTTTQFELDGYQVVRSLGVVRGIIVRSRSLFGTIGAGLQTLIGGNITLLTQLCEKTREDAFDLMLNTQPKSAPMPWSACVTTLRRSCRESPRSWPMARRW